MLQNTKSLKYQEAVEVITQAVGVITDYKHTSFSDAITAVYSSLGIYEHYEADIPLTMALALKALRVPGREAYLCVPAKNAKACISFQHYRRIVAGESYKTPEFQYVHTVVDDRRARAHYLEVAHSAWLQFTDAQRRAVWKDAAPILRKCGFLDVYLWQEPRFNSLKKEIYCSSDTHAVYVDGVLVWSDGDKDTEA